MKGHDAPSEVCKAAADALRFHLLRSYLDYYNETRTHLSLDKDAPVSRAIEAVGRVFGRPVLGGLHHQYVRI